MSVVELKARISTWKQQGYLRRLDGGETMLSNRIYHTLPLTRIDVLLAGSMRRYGPRGWKLMPFGLPRHCLRCGTVWKGNRYNLG